MKENGSFAVTNGLGAKVFQTNTGIYPGAQLKLENDGNLVVVTASGTPLWSWMTGGLTGRPPATTISSPGYGTAFVSTTTSVAVTWASVPGVSYLVRALDNTGAYPVYLDYYSGTSIAVPVVPGRSYSFWVHSIHNGLPTVPENYSDAIGVVFSVAP